MPAFRAELRIERAERSVGQWKELLSAAAVKASHSSAKATQVGAGASPRSDQVTLILMLTAENPDDAAYLTDLVETQLREVVDVADSGPWQVTGPLGE